MISKKVSEKKFRCGFSDFCISPIMRLLLAKRAIF
jgi:hypothetical protein